MTLKVGEFKAEVKLTPEQVKEAIKLYIAEQLGHKTVDVYFDVGDVANDPMDRFQTMGLRGATATVKMGG